MTKKAVATKEDIHGVPSLLAERMARDAGKGLSKDQADNMVPLVYILQALSPQVQKRNLSTYIEGAEPGSIWLRGVNDPIVAGDEGIIFQPCFFSKDWVEWIPRDAGGGFVGRYQDLPADAVKQQNNNRIRFVRPNGNELRETRYHAGLVYHGSHPQPFVIPMSSTGHTVSRAWMSRMNQRQLPSGGTAPSFAQLYRLKTVPKSNAMGEWFTWMVDDAGWVEGIKEYDLGSALHDAFASGVRRAEDDQADEDAVAETAGI